MNGPGPAAWSVLVVPAVERGRGSGHLKRSMALVRGLRELGRDAKLYLPGADRVRGRQRPAEELLAAFSGELDPAWVESGDPAKRRWTFVLLDRFRTSHSEFRFWSSIGPVVGIDEGGPRRASFDYLLDLLTPAPGLPPANEVSPQLLPAPSRRRPGFGAVGPGPLRILVVFGGEDPSGLSLAAAASLAAVPEVRVQLVLGALNAVGPAARAKAESERLSVSGPVPDLKERLADYDLVVTQFGLLAFEALAARLPVLLVSPTALHERVAKAAGFYSAGRGMAAARSLASHLPRIDEIRAASEQAAPSAPGSSYAERIAAIDFPSGVRCPLCSARPVPKAPALGRFKDRTYRRCPCCGLMFLTRTNDPPITYARNYFFDDYKKQYGKTYLEDFPNLERAGSGRVGRIAELLGGGPVPDPRLLDIGCAYGPFLSAARKKGFDAYGIDPAADAVRFVRDELGIPAVEGFFPELDARSAFGGDLFDAVTLWYVIEHFTRLGAVLASASRLLKSGGILAFSTPSGGGISARVRFPDFLEKSPADHFSIWEPVRAGRFLKRFGFRLEKIVVTGHHPERFPSLAEIKPDDPRWALAGRASRLFGLGDTFEVYARKEKSLL